jgi:hypothetical protein
VYSLQNTFLEREFYVSIVGCGGTGGYVAESLCRLLPRRAFPILIDPDRVEERNLTRQNFIRSELGEFKSEALAKRLSQKFDRLVGYSTLPVAMVKLLSPGLIIGCVDNGIARKNISQQYEKSDYSNTPFYRYSTWWVDAGNGRDYGQIIIGNGFRTYFEDKSPEICDELPLPTIQQPDLLKQAPQLQSCAQDDEQSPTINLVMASLVVDVVRRILEGTCPWSQLYVDLQVGTLTPVYIQPTK